MNEQLSYTLLSLPFLVLSISLWLLALRASSRLGDARGFARSSLWSLAALTLLTAVFDNVIIGSGLVAYNDENRLGPQIGLAPIEDFGYTLAACLGLPALWRLLDVRAERKSAHD